MAHKGGRLIGSYRHRARGDPYSIDIAKFDFENLTPDQIHGLEVLDLRGHLGSVAARIAYAGGMAFKVRKLAAKSPERTLVIEGGMKHLNVGDRVVQQLIQVAEYIRSGKRALAELVAIVRDGGWTALRDAATQKETLDREHLMAKEKKAAEQRLIALLKKGERIAQDVMYYRNDEVHLEKTLCALLSPLAIAVKGIPHGDRGRMLRDLVLVEVNQMITDADADAVAAQQLIDADQASEAKMANDNIDPEGLAHVEGIINKTPRDSIEDGGQNGLKAEPGGETGAENTDVHQAHPDGH